LPGAKISLPKIQSDFTCGGYAPDPKALHNETPCSYSTRQQFYRVLKRLVLSACGNIISHFGASVCELRDYSQSEH
jgi:hypothetical protein